MERIILYYYKKREGIATVFPSPKTELKNFDPAFCHDTSATDRKNPGIGRLGMVLQRKNKVEVATALCPFNITRGRICL